MQSHTETITTPSGPMGIHVVRPDGHLGGTALARDLVRHHADRGIQQVIWAGRIWRNTRASAGWRKYSGESDHFNHVHWELVPQAAITLTLEHITRTMEGDDMAQSEEQIEEWFVSRLEQKYRVYPENKRVPSAGDVMAWTDHLRARGHEYASDILAGVEDLLKAE